MKVRNNGIWAVPPGGILLGVIVLIASLPSTVLAKQYSVCDEQQLAGAIQSAAPGDQIVLCAGTWRDIHIKFDVDGTASAPITLRAAQPGAVVMTGSSMLSIGGSYAIVDGLVWRGTYTGTANGATPRVVEFRYGDARKCRYCRLTNSAIIDYNPVAGGWVRLYGQHNRVDHNYFSGKNTEGPLVTVVRTSNTADYARIDHNFFSRPPIVEGGGGGGESLLIGQDTTYGASDSFSVVESNVFHKASGGFEIVANKSSGNIYRRNTFFASQGALTLRVGNRTLVEGNFFLGGGEPLASGIRVYGKDNVIVNNYFEGLNLNDSWARGGIIVAWGDSGDPLERTHYAPIENALISHNTFVNTRASINFRDDRAVAPRNVVIRNNIVSYPGNTLVEGTKPDVLFAGNIFNGSIPTYVDTRTNRVGNPSLVLDSNGVQRLSSSSIAINSGVQPEDTAVDVSGNARVVVHDVGAEEHGSGPFRAPMGPCSVGPQSFRVGLQGTCTVKPRAPQLISAY